MVGTDCRVVIDQARKKLYFIAQNQEKRLLLVLFSQEVYFIMCVIIELSKWSTIGRGLWE